MRIITLLATARGFNHSQFARLAFAGEQSPEVKWRQIRNVSKDGRPQRLTLGDAARCAEALGEDLPEICSLAMADMCADGGVGQGEE